MIRVLVVVTSLRQGGAETYIARTAPLLRDRGVEVEVAALDSGGPLAEPLRAAGITIHGTRFPEWTRRRRGWLLAEVTGELRRLARGGGFDCLHTYLYWADVLGGLAGRLAGRHVIASRRSLHVGRHHPGARWLHGLEAAGNAAAYALVANSDAVLRDAAVHEAFLPRRRTVIYNGVDVDAYSAVVPGLGPRLRLLTVGALAAIKGQATAVEALALVHAAGVDAGLTLVGDGPDAADLRALAATRGVAGAVTFTGAAPDVRPFLAAADLFVLPSQQEGFSNALLEAMAVGLPAVATAVGGNPEALTTAGGRLVPADDSKAMATAIVELAGDRERLSAMGRHNFDVCRARFTLGESAARLAAWYRSCVS